MAGGVSEQERAWVQFAFSRIQDAGEEGVAEVADLLRSLPDSSPVLDGLSQCAHDLAPPARRNFEDILLRLEVVTAAPRPGGDSESPDPKTLLSLEGFPFLKVRWILDAVVAHDRSYGPAIRERLGTTAQPWLLATMASYLGRLGSIEDGGGLVSLLDHRDSRVVSNALDALIALDYQLPADRLGDLLESKHHRVRASALSLLSRLEPSQVFSRVQAMANAPDSRSRAAVAHLLGQLPVTNRTVELLVTLLARESDPGVIRVLAASIKHVAARRQAISIVGPLDRLAAHLMEMAEGSFGTSKSVGVAAATTTGGVPRGGEGGSVNRELAADTAGVPSAIREKLNVVRELLEEVGQILGWSVERIQGVGQEYARANPAAKDDQSKAISPSIHDVSFVPPVEAREDESLPRLARSFRPAVLLPAMISQDAVGSGADSASTIGLILMARVQALFHDSRLILENLEISSRSRWIIGCVFALLVSGSLLALIRGDSPSVPTIGSGIPPGNRVPQVQVPTRMFPHREPTFYEQFVNQSRSNRAEGAELTLPAVGSQVEVDGAILSFSPKSLTLFSGGVRYVFHRELPFVGFRVGSSMGVRGQVDRILGSDSVAVDADR